MRRLPLLPLAGLLLLGCDDSLHLDPVGPVTAAVSGGEPLSGAPFPAVAVVAGDLHACALGVDRRAYCWGDNTEGQLGDGSNVSSSRPVPVVGRLRFVHLTSGGWKHTCGLTAAGEAYCWGWNPFGQLGDGSTSNSNVPVRAASALTFTSLDAGPYQTCGVTSVGGAYCWGANGALLNNFGGASQVGFALGAPTTETCVNPVNYRGSPWPCSPTPLAVSGGISFGPISVGLWGACGIAASGVTYCWGYNFGDQLGLGAGMLAGVMAPTPVVGGHAFGEVSLGALHSCGLEQGDAYCWGATLGGGAFDWGQLGNGSSATGSNAPVAVSGGVSFASTVASDANNIFGFTCGVSMEGVVYCWGSNRRGALGTDAVLPLCAGSVPCSSVPVPIATDINFTAVALGSEFACAVARSRAMYCWGRNEAGQLGDGSTTDRFTPVRVQSPDRGQGSSAAPPHAGLEMVH